MGATEIMFKIGVFHQDYEGIIEIFPRRAMNSFTFEAALEEIREKYTIVKIFSDWYRAFKR